MKDLSIAENQRIDDRIYTIRGVQVMLDEDLAKLYQVESKRLNELDNSLRLQIATSSSMQEHGGRRYLPYAFTEQGVSMLSAVLKS
jgi:hypothetical protein